MRQERGVVPADIIEKGLSEVFEGPGVPLEDAPVVIEGDTGVAGVARYVDKLEEGSTPLLYAVMVYKIYF